jgi:hypothetical protein
MLTLIGVVDGPQFHEMDNEGCESGRQAVATDEPVFGLL